MPVSPHSLLQHVQDRTTDLRRWLDTGENTATLTAYLRDEPVDHRWLSTYRRLTHDLLRAVETELAGTYIMPSFGRYEQCAELVRRLRAREAATQVRAMA